jgi:hypothetical protein
VRFSLAVLIVVVTYCSVLVPPTWSQPPPDIQLTAAAATILYFPFNKAAFALGGGIVGGLAYVFSGFCETTAKRIWIPSLYGTYIITPEHPSLDRPIRFLGVVAESEGYPPPPAPINQ